MTEQELMRLARRCWTEHIPLPTSRWGRPWSARTAPCTTCNIENAAFPAPSAPNGRPSSRLSARAPGLSPHCDRGEERGFLCALRLLPPGDAEFAPEIEVICLSGKGEARHYTPAPAAAGQLRARIPVTDTGGDGHRMEQSVRGGLCPCKGIYPAWAADSGASSPSCFFPGKKGGGSWSWASFPAHR